MPGSIINYAVVQSEDKDEFYSDHAVDGSYYSGGSIFSQRYNKRDFSDPVTVLFFGSASAASDCGSASGAAVWRLHWCSALLPLRLLIPKLSAPNMATPMFPAILPLRRPDMISVSRA